jgi:hypothetical protein
MFNDSKQFGMLFANPIPEEFSMQKAEIDNAINQAVHEAADQGFHGHANTPFILSRIKELTHGSSILANSALIGSNVAMAAKVAVELSKFRVHTSRDLFPPAQKQYLDTLKKGIEVDSQAQKQFLDTLKNGVEFDRRRLNKLLTALNASKEIRNLGTDKGDSATEAINAEGKPQNKSVPNVAVGPSLSVTGSKWYNSEINFNYAAGTCTISCLTHSAVGQARHCGLRICCY